MRYTTWQRIKIWFVLVWHAITSKPPATWHRYREMKPDDPLWNSPLAHPIVTRTTHIDSTLIPGTRRGL